MDQQTLKQYLADSPPSVVRLEIEPHFNALAVEQKLYAHHLARAAYHGTRVILRQVSPESEAIYDLILALHNACKGDWKQLQAQAGLSDDDLGHFLDYSTQFLGNLGNYKGFGDSKFLPRLSPDAFEKLASQNEKAKALFEGIGGKTGAIYSGAEMPNIMLLGFPDQGHMTSYYLGQPISKEEVEAISQAMAENDILPENTRVKKIGDGEYELLVASGISSPPSHDIDTTGAKTSFPIHHGDVKGTLRLVFGDHQEEMAKIALEMKKAEHYAANATQKAMMEQYAKSFGTGSLKAYKKSQESWVKDIGPKVETCIGFVETYRDPAGVRAEWEGFVAMVNQERTRAFGKLVESAPKMIPKLPWAKDFEKDTFTPPDFTSLEVLAFASSGIPAGINIPNYDDIRANIGFKNVSLGNVLSAKAPNEPIPFIHDDDQELFRACRDPAFEVQVGIHELLGHGTGKLLQETAPGVYNFDHTNPPVSPVTNAPVTTWYKPGQTWSSVFGAMSSSYEECRAEAVAMHLCCDFDILRIFGLDTGSTDLAAAAADGPVDESSEAFKVLYAAYLSMARAGVVAVEFWDPKSRKWGQAHMQARFSILRAFLDGNDPSAPRPFCELITTPAAGGSSVDDAPLQDLIIRIDPAQIRTTGRKAVAKYLQQLHVYKATADLEAGSAMYERMTHVDAWWADKVRPLVLQKKVPRKVFVMANTAELEAGAGPDKVVLKEYEPTREGMIQSWAERDV